MMYGSFVNQFNRYDIKQVCFHFWMGKQSCESDSELLVDVYSLAIYVYFCKGEILSLLTFGV